ncbi:MAG: hypothetical protein II711_00125, partial [Clostridia bacterium]|nr:hypothetical protein [Clostridia bacterium]
MFIGRKQELQFLEDKYNSEAEKEQKTFFSHRKICFIEQLRGKLLPALRATSLSEGGFISFVYKLFTNSKTLHFVRSLILILKNT